LLAANPRLLISVGGLNYNSDLKFVSRELPNLPKQRVLYEVHEYTWFHGHRLREGGQDYECAIDSHWGHMLREEIAPVLVSEFGMSHRYLQDETEAAWVTRFSSYIQQQGLLNGGLDWSYWQLSGVQAGGKFRSRGSIETFGVLNECWTAPANSSHFGVLRQLQELGTSSELTGPPPPRQCSEVSAASLPALSLLTVSACVLLLLASFRVSPRPWRREVDSQPPSSSPVDMELSKRPTKRT